MFRSARGWLSLATARHVGARARGAFRGTAASSSSSGPPIAKTSGKARASSDLEREAETRQWLWERIARRWAPLVSAATATPQVQDAQARLYSVFHKLFEYRPDGRGRPMGFVPSKIDLDTKLQFRQWNMAKACEFFALSLPLERLPLELAPPVSDESLFRFVTSLQEASTVFAHAERDPKTRHLLLGRFLQDTIAPYPLLNVHVGRKLVGKHAFGHTHYTVGAASTHSPYVLVIDCLASSFETGRAIALVQMRAAFDRLVSSHRSVERLHAIVSDTRTWHFLAYEPARYMFFEAEPIVVTDVYDVDALELLLCALNYVLADAQEQVSTNRTKSEGDARRTARVAAQFVPFRGLAAAPMPSEAATLAAAAAAAATAGSAADASGALRLVGERGGAGPRAGRASALTDDQAEDNEGGDDDEHDDGELGADNALAYGDDDGDDDDLELDLDEPGEELDERDDGRHLALPAGARARSRPASDAGRARAPLGPRARRARAADLRHGAARDAADSTDAWGASVEPTDATDSATRGARLSPNRRRLGRG